MEVLESNTMLELNKIYNCDCLEGMKEINDNSIDLVLTSPPYDNSREYLGFKFDFESISNELYRIIKLGGVIVWIVGDQCVNGSETGTSFKQALYFKEIGLKLHDTMIYKKINYVPLTHNRYEQSFEYMFIFVKGKIKTFNPIMVNCDNFGLYRNENNNYKIQMENKLANKAMRKREEIFQIKEYKIKSNIWEYHVGKNQSTKDDIAFIHPAIFPEQLAEDHILSWSNENDIIFDPMCGSGTTLKIALKNNRKYIGMDISVEYCNIANQRIENTISGINKPLIQNKPDEKVDTQQYLF